MKNRLFLLYSFVLLVAGFVSNGCSDDKTYVEKLADERKAIQKFLADKQTSSTLPEDGNFDPNIYYSLGDGVYMQVENAGDLNRMAEAGAIVLFRYKRTDLFTMETTDVNWNVSSEDSDYQPAILYYQTTTSSSYGEGIQLPLKYVGEEAVVQVLVPSKMGSSVDEGNVIPILYLIRYTSITNR